MPNILNNLGTRLFQSVTDKAGDIGDRFEEEFSRLAQNITADIDEVVDEIAELSVFIKITLVLLSVLLFIIILRYLAFGGRALFFKNHRIYVVIRERSNICVSLTKMGVNHDQTWGNETKEWLRESENRQPPQVILLMPHKDEQIPMEISGKGSITPSLTPPFSPDIPFRSQQKPSTALNIYADPLTFQNLENIKRNSYALFNKTQQ